MRIKQRTENGIILALPMKQRYLGVLFTLLGILIPIVLYFANSFQTTFLLNLEFGRYFFYISLGSLLSLIFVFELPSIVYFFSIHNKITGFGHIILLILNVTVYLGTYSSIFAFSPVLIIGIYLLSHVKTIHFKKDKAHLSYFERIFLIFIAKTVIPFSEIEEIVLEYKIGKNFLRKGKDQHQYRIKLYLTEKDPGFEDEVIADGDEKDTLEFFRPQTLRKKLISKPFLINSSFLNFKGEEMVKNNQLLKKLLKLTEFSKSEEIIKGNITIRKFRG